MPYYPAFMRPAWPTAYRVLIVLALYALYLPLSGYTIGQFRFDAAEYWELSLQFTQHGSFSLLTFDEPLRGYVGPLLVLPARLLCHFTGCSMLTGARVLGAGWAAVLFGVAIPQLWARVVGRPISGGRWLLLLGLAFLFWRDYFNFTLSDMPALTLLVLSLVALGQSRWIWAVVAGLFLAAAINIRPIYLASLPGGLWLLLAAPGAVAQRSMRMAALLVGAAVVLLPQSLINKRHFHRATPLVTAGRPGARPLYLRQLAWGTAYQRYETSLIPGIPRSLVYADPAGQQALADVPDRVFADYGQFLSFVARQPLASGGRLLHHLFNGLDIWFPTPYPTRLHPPFQAGLRLLNYALIGLGLWLAVAAIRKKQPIEADNAPAYLVSAVLLALGLPCLLALPTLMECRFMLPLHLLILTGVAASWRPSACWHNLRSPARRVAVLALAAGWLWGCWQLSESTAQQLRPPSEAPQD
jgi:hypothetical protein